MAPSMRTFSSFLFLASFVHYKIYMSRFSLFPVQAKSMHGSKRRYEQLEPQLPKDIAADYRRGVRGHGRRAFANTCQLPIPTVQHVVARATRPGGDPDAPRGHKRRKLDEVDEAKLCRTLDRNAFAAQTEIWRLLLATKFQNEV